MSQIPTEPPLTTMARQETAIQIVRQVQALAPVNDLAPDAWQLYWDTIGSYGEYADDDPETGQVTDPSLAAIGITKAQLLSCVTLLENIKHFFASEQVTTNTYRITVNSVRHLKV